MHYVWQPSAVEPLTGVDGIPWSVEVQGSLLQVRKHCPCGTLPPDRTNSSIQGFSAASKLRALRALARIDWERCQPCLFISLTYPDLLISRKHADRNKDRWLFHRYMENSLGRKVSAFWRMEWEIRKSGMNKGYIVPHIHLMYTRVSYIHHENVRCWWRKILGASGPLCTDVRKMYGVEGGYRYMLAYVAKSASLDYRPYLNSGVTVGRAWGFQRKSGMPTCPRTVICDLEQQDVEFLKNLARETYPFYGQYGEGGFTMFGRDVAAAVQKRFGFGLSLGKVA